MKKNETPQKQVKSLITSVSSKTQNFILDYAFVALSDIANRHAFTSDYLLQLVIVIFRMPLWKKYVLL